jgi:type IV pilus assembly protein PilB
VATQTQNNAGKSSSGSSMQSAISDINQEFREREVQKKAEQLGVSYIDVSLFPINDDVLKIISEEESHELQMIPFFQVGKKIRVATVDSTKKEFIAKITELEEEGNIVNINLCSKEKLLIAQQKYKNIKKHDSQAEDLEKQNLSMVKNISEEIKNLIDIPEKFKEIKSDLALGILNRKALSLNVSDIHMESLKNGVRVRGRIDGVLKDFFTLSSSIASGIIRQIKFNAKILSNLQGVPQDGQFIFFIEDREVMVRVSILPENNGESIVLRYLDPKKQNLDLHSLGFSDENFTKIENFLALREGFVVVTGPTGSGKTTTLYSLIKKLNSPEKKIITLEDPVEYTLNGIVQSSINEEKGYSFQSGLKSCLRQDPDVILIGEIRDFETAKTSLQAALTGHLVLSTLHTNSALETITRLKDLKVQNYLIGNALKGIIAQRLLRTVCPHCKEEQQLSEQEKQVLIGILKPLIDSGKKIPPFSGKTYVGKGCSQCGKTGYKGRTVINEILTITPDISKMILEEKNSNEIRQLLEKEGQTFFAYDAAIKILQGKTNFKEVVRVLGTQFLTEKNSEKM